MSDYFATFDLKRSFIIDKKNLEEKYILLTKKLSEEELGQVNLAYFTLKNEISRGIYLYSKLYSIEIDKIKIEPDFFEFAISASKNELETKRIDYLTKIEQSKTIQEEALNFVKYRYIIGAISHF